MAIYRDASCRLCRRERMKLMLKGDRCVSAKCPITKRRDVPGPVNRKMKQLSEYGVQMREKQKVKRIYGILERQLRNYYHEASRIRFIDWGLQKAGLKRGSLSIMDLYPLMARK